MKSKPKKCVICNKAIKGNSTIKKYCSYACTRKSIQKKAKKKKTTRRMDLLSKDIAWALTVKENSGNKCEVCGETKYLNAHHIFTRANKKMRHNLDNGIALCPKHHLFDTYLSAHKAPIEFIEWLKAKRGEEWYNELRRQAKSL